MKSVLISTKPKWCELIVNGKKTVEVRKTTPKLKTPFKVYIYCTKGNLALLRDDSDTEKYKYDVWKYAEFHQSCGKKILGGKVIGEFVCDEIKLITPSPFTKGEYVVYGHGRTMLRLEEFQKYLGDRVGYGWHISNLVIYDKPRELSEFYTVDNEAVKQCEHRERVYNNPDFTNGAWLLGSYVCNKDEIDWCTKCKTKPIKRPPQSWMYCESEVAAE